MTKDKNVMAASAGKNIFHLNPRRKLVDEVVDWLFGGEEREPKIRKTDEGALSLAHILVIVPTAQSARNLRLSLVKRAAKEGRGAVIPPMISMANMLLIPSDKRIASEAEELSVMAEVLLDCDLSRYKALFPRLPGELTTEWALDMATALLGVKSVLGEAGLMMSDVKSELDGERWKNLGQIENLFVEKLKSNGVMPRCVARRKSACAGCLEHGIEEIVLPSSLDIQNIFADYLKNSSQNISILIHADKSDAAKFDEWGRPKEHFSADIDPAYIDSFPNPVIEADETAKFFRSVKHNEALPALVVCDSEMYPELEGAFQNYFSAEELVLRNPSKELVSKSALGRLLGGIVSLESTGDYDTFSSLLRSGDVARWAKDSLGVSAAEIARFTGALDTVQNIHLPRTIDEVIAGSATEAEMSRRESERTAAAGLKIFAEAVKKEIKNPMVFLQKIFSSVTLDENNPGDRELIAAAKAVRELREICASDLISDRLRKKLFSRLLNQASYMLEPTAENVLVTTGWLELPWCIEDEIVITGFNEGCVPENIVGHPFIPDALRSELGISSNASREIRDSLIFSQAVKCRGNGAVLIHMHQISSDKNVMKPSRILFNGISDANLPSLAKRLYAATKGNSGVPAKALPAAWRLDIPVPPKGTVYREKISPTQIDNYLRCPFNFYLNELFGEHSDDRAQELNALEFGSLCHSALEAFAKNGPKDSADSSEIAEFLSGEIDRLLLSFGTALPAIIELQGEAAKERLRAFAVRQAKRRAEGWRIVSSELSLKCRIKQCPTILSGKIDRIDQHEDTGDLAIIDYKTWSKFEKGKCEESFQLPIYRAMLETSGEFPPEKARASKAFYYILAERAEDSLFYEGAAWHEGLQSEAEDKVVEVLTNIAKGIFYPPKEKKIQSAYASLIWQSVEEGVNPGWIADQISRMGGQE